MNQRTPKRPTAVWRSGLALGIVAALVAAGTPALAEDEADVGATAAADIGFHDLTRTGEQRAIRNDLSGQLQGMVEFAQATTVDPKGNSAQERPNLVADREALLLFTPVIETDYVQVAVRHGNTLLGYLFLDEPSQLPAADQSFDQRGSVAYSLRAWSVKIPDEWVKPGLRLTFGDGAGRYGSTTGIDFAAPAELVINNIRLGMLTDAPTGNGHRFITDPVWGGTDYFQTLPISKLTVAQYETVKLDKVIVGNGSIYTVASPDPSTGDVYSGKMREDVGKAQVSTGINLATWGITSSPMNQVQPGHTNQRVIHHSAGLYSNGRQVHGLSGGNGMATLYDSVGNELSHELGHSYGLGHYPGMDWNASGDDIARNASHHMDSGWGYIGYRNLMRSNLSDGSFQASVGVNGAAFAENLAGKYNFNKDAMSGGWDASPISDYTHHTAYTLKRIQNSFRTLVADTSYPSGYRDWDQTAGTWVDAKVKTPSFSLPAPSAVGVPVRTILGGYNPANAGQTLLYPAFRSNYGVTFDLPQSDPSAVAAARACWLEVDYQDGSTDYITLNSSDGVKQLNVNLPESAKATAAQVACRANGVTTALGEPIAIAADLPAMAAPVVIGQDAGFEALRARELGNLTPKLTALAAAANPVLSPNDLLMLNSWADDLSLLPATARTVADRILAVQADAAWVSDFVADNAATATPAQVAELSTYLTSRGYVTSAASILPTPVTVTVDNGRCLFVDDAAGQAVRVDPTVAGCAGRHPAGWFTDAAGRIHPGAHPELCMVAMTPVQLRDCSTTDSGQAWAFLSGGAGPTKVARAGDTNSVLDYYRAQGYPGMWASSDGANQQWTGFTASPNAILGALDGPALAGLWGMLTP